MIVHRLLLCPVLLSAAALLFTPHADAQQKTTAKNAPAEKGAKTSAAANARKGTPAAQVRTTGQDGVQELVLPTVDGWGLHATWYPATGGRESPALILLTSTDGSENTDARNRRVWQPVASELQKAGFAVIAVDLRKHGDSIPAAAAGGDTPALKTLPADYALMAANDLEAVKYFLMEQHRNERLNIRKLGIVSMGSSAMVAAAFTIADWAKTPFPDAATIEMRTPRGQDVRSLVMYSPNSSVKGINSSAVLKTLKGLPVPVYVVAAKENKDDLRNAEKVFQAVELKGEQFKESRRILIAPGTTHAEAFIEGRLADAASKDLLEFLSKNLVSLDAPWRDRTDRRTK
jgi:pimeloyl-ACP methyl ester carboxylesterase